MKTYIDLKILSIRRMCLFTKCLQWIYRNQWYFLFYKGSQCPRFTERGGERGTERGEEGGGRGWGCGWGWGEEGWGEECGGSISCERRGSRQGWKEGYESMAGHDQLLAQFIIIIAQQHFPPFHHRPRYASPCLPRNYNQLMTAHQLALLCLSLLFLSCLCDSDAGARRLLALTTRSLNSSNRILNFTAQDFSQYVMKYPRPYDLVLYFAADSFALARELYPEYEYLVKLYDMNGAIFSDRAPTFFAVLPYTRATAAIFSSFEFESVPNMVVSKPHMAVVSDSQRKAYNKEFSWEISHTDNHVTTHKMLEFVNKRTKKAVEYRHTQEKIYEIMGWFGAVALAAVVAYKLLRPIWNHWIFWFIASLAVYLTCCSGIVYCHLHDVPFMTQDQRGQPSVFAHGSREQTGLEGWIISGVIVTIGLMFVLIAVLGEKCSQKFSVLFCLMALVVIYAGVNYLERVYKQKGWYGPSFAPPGEYLKGPLNVDQGNNI